MLIFIPLAIALPKSFFEDWGWLIGPGAWIVCTLFTGRVLKLPLDRVFAAGLLAAIPSVIGVLLDAHQVGGVVAVIVFGLLCGYIPRRSGSPPLVAQ